MTDSVYLILSSENLTGASFLNINTLKFWNDLEIWNFFAILGLLSVLWGESLILM